MNRNFRKHSLPMVIIPKTRISSGQGLVEYAIVIFIGLVVLACPIIIVYYLWEHVNSVGHVSIIVGIVGMAVLITMLLFGPPYIAYLRKVSGGEMQFLDFLSTLTSQQPSERTSENGKLESVDTKRYSRIVRTIEIVAAIATIISCVIAALTLIVDIVK